jgi:hypothetical protein
MPASLRTFTAYREIWGNPSGSEVIDLCSNYPSNMGSMTILINTLIEVIAYICRTPLGIGAPYNPSHEIWVLITDPSI